MNTIEYIYIFFIKLISFIKQLICVHEFNPLTTAVPYMSHTRDKMRNLILQISLHASGRFIDEIKRSVFAFSNAIFLFLSFLKCVRHSRT